jgi:hypothetical protein
VLHYRIMGNFQGSTEEIDQTSNKQTAQYLQREYSVSYGKSWHIWVEVQTYVQGCLDECYPLIEG